MSNATPSFLGQRGGAGDVTANWLEIFTGEVLTAYEIARYMSGKVRSRAISGGTSAKFAATYRANARIHIPGSEILGQTIQGNDINVFLDDLTIADVFVAKIDELKNEYDVRAPYAQALGDAMGLYEDRIISSCIVNAARTTTPLFVGDGAGTQLVDNVALSGTSDFTASGSDLISGLNLAKQSLDVLNVPVDRLPLYAMLRPAAWYLIANSDKNINRLFNGGDSTLARQVLKTVSDIEVMKSNAPLFGYNATVYNSSTNATGVVSNADPVVIGTTTPAAASLPQGIPLPGNYPTKYQNDQRKTTGIVWVEAAAAILNLLGLEMETAWDTRRQGTLMIAKKAFGADKLRVKCAVELQHSANY